MTGNGLLKKNSGMKTVEIHCQLFGLCQRRLKRDKNILIKVLSERSKTFYLGIKKHISNLHENPDYRRMGVDNYIVLYQVFEETK